MGRWGDLTGVGFLHLGEYVLLLSLSRARVGEILSSTRARVGETTAVPSRQ
ncbi:MAG: hypothetical protein F6J94_11200 [Moorea sp. SIO1F2]|uniref:hypothetical protein n=1 Tax=unclassified Moorena TaxID=2683338 RepID=UPI0013B7FF13|nr:MULTISPECIES: hypothetical protein [unclassified Moorena]NEQ56451.1 hypothetical protein [Moorena sp. SIO4A1]NET82475.1 hypothetical protein [Moorena sp. SIO1F2]